jgi:indolepyruvate ferredoxin oxidoreductase beta subunit
MSVVVGPIKIAIMALGGQGGGVLADWIIALGERAGFQVQATSVPGVAQRTGATIYYVELFPANLSSTRSKAPVLALMPLPGDVDIVIASELMEAARALARGFVSQQTTLVFSTHRDYAIGEKIAMGDGRVNSEAVLEALGVCGARLYGADLAAASAGAPLSAVLFGALAGSGALPISADVFVAVLTEGRSSARNLVMFEAGRVAVLGGNAVKPTPENGARTSAKGEALRVAGRIEAEVPPEAGEVARIGAERCVDFQDWRYAHSYLDRICRVAQLERESGANTRGFRLTAIVAKRLAAWMAYEDAIRVADLKTRASRFSRAREDVRAAPEQIVWFSEYLHPRAEEICDLLPGWLARALLSSRTLKHAMNAALGGGRRISTNRLRGFLPLWLMSNLRPWRRGSYRFATEQRRIETWLAHVNEAASADHDLACELAELPTLLKGYGETHERGLQNFERILGVLAAVKAASRPATALKRLREAALSDEEGAALASAISALAPNAIERTPERAK